jgi:hypothetical protein
MSKSKTLQTRYGPVDAAILEHLRNSFDTHRILDAVDAIDRIRDRICEADRFRQELLALHGMAHELINGGENPLGSSSQEAIWEVAENLSSELLEFTAGLEAAYDNLEEIGKLMPTEDWEEEEMQEDK